MWTTTIACSACDGTHTIQAESIPRAFSYDCPVSQERVPLHFRDPSRMPDPWVETDHPVADAVPALLAEMHGRLDL